MKPCESPSLYGYLAVMMAPREGEHTSCVYLRWR
jgi:hypothetical protein